MTRTALLLAALCTLFVTGAGAQSPAPAAFTVISPIFGQLVMFSMPRNFAAIGENTNGPSYIREAVPKDETAERWTEMITVTGAKGLVSNPKVSPEAFAGSIVGGFKSACPDSFAAKALGPAKFGEHDAFVAVTGCGRVDQAADKHSETALVIAVKGSADYYTLQWAERTPSAAKPAIDDAKWLERLGLLQPIRFCAIVAGEAAPYPSCVGKN
jgi:hypothetical protein